MSSLLASLVSVSATRVLPLLAGSNLVFYTLYKSTGVMTWVDVGWVFNHLLAGGYHFYANQAHNSMEGRLYMLLLVAWASRLGFHLVQRCLTGHSDPRYDLISNRWNLRKSLLNLIQFEFQALLTVLTAIPLFYLFKGLPMNNVLPLDWKTLTGVGFVVVGIIGEWISDHQLEQFKRNNANKHESTKDKPLCQTGLWKYSRHPNLFFELCTWGGFAFLGAKSFEKNRLFSFLGPVLLYFIMDLLSTRITEKHMSKSRSNWKEHIIINSFSYSFALMGCSISAINHRKNVNRMKKNASEPLETVVFCIKEENLRKNEKLSVIALKNFEKILIKGKPDHNNVLKVEIHSGSITTNENPSIWC